MEDGSERNPFVLDDDAQERLALLQQMYQQKQELLLRGATAAVPPVSSAAPQFPAVSLQQLQQYLAALQQQQENMDTGSTSSLTGAGLGGSSGGSMPQTPTTSVASTGSSVSSTHAAAAAAALAAASTPPQNRSRKLTMETRSLSGSSQTISQHTKDRLKMMIISKRGSTDSSDGGGPPSATLTGPASGMLPTTTAPAPGGGPITAGGSGHRRAGTSRTPPGHMGSHAAGPSPHFEPYPVPSGHQRDANIMAQAGEFALRKVNSEPNMKMKIRARLLSKGNSPVHSANSAFNFHHPGHLQRQDSDTSSSSTGLAPPTIVFPPSMLMMPSPSLPNLAAAAAAGSLLQQQQADMAQLLAQAAGGTNLSSFLSLPSLFKQQMGLGGSSNSVDVEQQQQQLLDANRMQLDPRIAALGTANLPCYPSLLKQQLRELVLRRKSLVREEPEGDDGTAAALAALAARNGGGSAFSAPSGGSSSSSAAPPAIDVAALAAHLLQLSSGGCSSNDAAAAAVSAAMGAAPATAPSTSQAVTEEANPPTGLAYDQTMAAHACHCEDATAHVEHGGRVRSVWTRLEQAGLTQRCLRVESRAATLDELKRVHSTAYVDFFGVAPAGSGGGSSSRQEAPVKSFVQLGCGGIGVDSDTYYNERTTAAAARAAAGNLIDLCSAVVEGKVRNGFACIRPPGHHAEREVAMGFCYFNNVAVAARALQARYPEQCKKIAIVDWDVHHGNGTQPAFDSDPSVLYLSVHRHDNGNFFPGTGAVTDAGKGEGKGYSLNVAFSGGVMGDAEYLAAWRVVVQPVLQSFRPDFILVSAGFDAARGHPHALGGYEVSPQLFGWMTRSLMSLAGGKVVLAMEGGYNLDTIAESAEECVRALMTPGDTVDVRECRVSDAALEALPSNPAQETIQKVIACHKLYWPVLSGGLQPINISEQQWQVIHAQFR
ncbi:hypothetical protein PFISCL1PPCAC_22855, partial [Pristionchus fissidentatus]